MWSIRLWVVVAMIAVCGVSATPALAADHSDPSSQILYHGGMVRKLGRGLANLMTGWAELPLNMQRTAANDGQVAGLSLGLVRGLGYTVLRELAGGYETVTFILPNANKLGYSPVLEPEFIELGNLS